MDADMRDSIYTAAFAATALGVAKMVTSGGFSPMALLDTQVLLAGAAAGAAEFGSEKVTNQVGGAGSDTTRLVRTAAAGLGAGGVTYYFTGDMRASALAAGAGVAGHLGSQYYVYGGVNL